MVWKVYHTLILILTSTTFNLAQAPQPQQTTAGNIETGATAEVATVTKYVWRGQRLTNDFSLQPSGTLQAGDFSVNVWGTLGLAAVNEGDVLLFRENPMSSSRNQNGLQGKFSEVDYTFSYSVLTENIKIDFGSIIYTFPERSVSLPSTVEFYGSMGFDTIPLAPAMALYIDLDETREAGNTEMYLRISGQQTFSIGHARFPAIDLSGWVAFANNGFGNYYYGVEESGVHDVNLMISVPLNLSERAKASFFLASSALVGSFRSHQYQDARAAYKAIADSPSSYADTIWGGVRLGFDF